MRPQTQYRTSSSCAPVSTLCRFAAATVSFKLRVAQGGGAQLVRYTGQWRDNTTQLWRTNQENRRTHWVTEPIHETKMLTDPPYHQQIRQHTPAPGRISCEERKFSAFQTIIESNQTERWGQLYYQLKGTHMRVEIFLLYSYHSRYVCRGEAKAEKILNLHVTHH